MSDINACTFSGNLGRDAELKWLPNQTAVLNFSIANSTGYGDKKFTTWINCGIFGKFGEAMEPYLKKGVKVTVSGEIRMNKWQSDQGEKQSLQLRCSQCDTHNRAEGGYQSQPSGQQGFRKDKPAQPSKQSDFEDDDIPF